LLFIDEHRITPRPDRFKRPPLQMTGCGPVVVEANYRQSDLGERPCGAASGLRVKPTHLMQHHLLQRAMVRHFLSSSRDFVAACKRVPNYRPQPVWPDVKPAKNFSFVEILRGG
jgi:hypothetical protein